MRILLSFLIIFSSFTAYAGKVCSANDTNSALIVIDMQPYFAERGENHERPENKKKIAAVLNEQLRAIEQAKKLGIPVVFIEYYQGGMDMGATSSQLTNAVKGYPNAKVFRKTSDGMFSSYNRYREELVDYLQSKRIGNLIITGANGGACVYSSIQGALDENCSVVAYDKGIADFNYRDFIYPYSGYYTGEEEEYLRINARCPNCTFKEVSNAAEVTQAMIRGPSGKPVSGVKKDGAR